MLRNLNEPHSFQIAFIPSSFSKVNKNAVRNFKANENAVRNFTLKLAIKEVVRLF